MTAPRSRRAFEIGCWTLGLVLLAGYAGGRGLGALERHRALAAFDAARASNVSAEPTRSDAMLPPLPPLAPQGRLVVGGPDQSDWTQARRSHYAALESAPSDAYDASALPAAVLRIERVGLEVPVFAEENERNLNRGAVLVAGTAMLDSSGNVGIAAHRDGYFRVLEQVVVGDVVEVVTLARAQRYRVARLAVVTPDDTRSLRPTDQRTLTLVTCYPFRFVGTAPLRYVVRAVALD